MLTSQNNLEECTTCIKPNTILILILYRYIVALILLLLLLGDIFNICS